MISLAPGHYLIRQGDAPTCGYLIESGTVDVVSETADGERLLAVLGEGEIVGEMALVDRAPRMASVRAREACTVRPITADSLDKRLATVDPVLRLVLGTILDRFRAMAGRPGDAPAGPSKRTLGLRAAAYAELRLEEEFARALADDQIAVHYQPIIDLADHRITGFEALARWIHPVRGLISPAVFVPIAEAGGSSGLLTRVCLRRVAADLVEMRRHAHGRTEHVCEPRVAVNVAGHDLVVPGFIRGLADLLMELDVHPSAITLELTETMLVTSPDEAVVVLQEARDLGFKIAIDDFGTGYSTLNYIRTLPIDTLKIDRSFIQGMTTCETTRSIVASTLMLAASLEIATVGEGIEVGEQHAMLQMLGCDYGQGYLFGRPMPLPQALDLIDGWNASRTPVAEGAIFLQEKANP